MTMPPPGPARRTGPQLAPLLIAAAVAVVLAGAVLLWLTGFNPGSLLDDKRLNTVLTVLTTAIGAAVKLVRRRTPPESTDRLDLAHRELTERLARLYRIEAVDTGLLGPRMGVRWRILPVQDSPRDTTVLPAWFRVRPERRLVILGGPGSGKRSAALLIALDLLAGRGPDSIRATPVLLGVGGWDPGTPLLDHLATRLDQQFGFLRRDPGLARRLLDDGRILPCLYGVFPSVAKEDGDADGIRARDRALVTALNRGAGFIVLADVEGYRDATTDSPELDATHVELHRVEPHQACAYLRSSVPIVMRDNGLKLARRERIVADLQASDDERRDVLTTPLYLAMLNRLVYRQDGSRLGLTTGRPEIVKARILLGSVGLHDAETLEPPLRFLATRMKQTRTTVLEMSRIQALTDGTSRLRRPLRLLAPVLVGSFSGAVVCGLVAVVGAIIHNEFTLGMPGGALLGAVCGVASGAASELRGSASRQAHGERRAAHRRFFSWGMATAAGAVVLSVLLIAHNLTHAGPASVSAAVVFLLAGVLSSPAPAWTRHSRGWEASLAVPVSKVNVFLAVAVGLVVGRGIAETDGWALGLGSGVSLGFAFGFLDRLLHHEHDAVDPRDAARAAGRNALITSLVFGITLATPLGVLFGLRNTATRGLLDGTIVGVTVTSGVLVLAVLAVWWAMDDRIRTGMALLQLRAGGGPRISPRLLEDACGLGLLRHSGSGYAFRHSDLLDAYSSGTMRSALDDAGIDR